VEQRNSSFSAPFRQTAEPFFVVGCVASRPAAASSECGVEMTAGRRAVHPRWMLIFAAATTRQRIAR